MVKNEDALQILEGKLKTKTNVVVMTKEWTKLDTYENGKRLAEGRCQCRACIAAYQPSDQEDDSCTDDGDGDDDDDDESVSFGSRTAAT